MKTTVNIHDFREAFRSMGRENSFSYEGLGALFEWIEELDESCGTETELDVIALDCEFREWENLEELRKEYEKEDFPDLDALRDHTHVIEIPGTERFITGEF